MDIKAWANGNWDSEESALDAFESYFRCHYEPFLNKLADNRDKLGLSDKEKQLLGFMRDDFIKIFGSKEV